MKIKKFIKIIIILLFLNFFQNIIYTQDFKNIKLSYRISLKNSEQNTTQIIQKVESGYKLDLKHSILYFDNEFNLIQVQTINTDSDEVILTMQKKGNQLYINGEGINKKINLDLKTWIHPGFIWLPNFIQGNKTKLDIIAIRVKRNEIDGSISELIPNDFVLKKEENTIIKIDGQKYETIKIIYTLTDWRSAFWKNEYWFCIDDGIVIRKKTNREPNTPIEIAELISLEKK